MLKFSKSYQQSFIEYFCSKTGSIVVSKCIDIYGKKSKITGNKYSIGILRLNYLNDLQNHWVTVQ